jgi:DNA-binding transcriptional LysR family regulator
VNRALLCAAPSYLEKHGTPRRLADLRDHDCVLFPPMAPKGVWTFRRGAQKHSVQVSGSFETDEMEAVRAAVWSGLGIGIVPGYMAGEALRRAELVALFPQFRPPESGIYLVYLPNRTLPARVRALIDFLVERFAPVPPWEARW